MNHEGFSAWLDVARSIELAIRWRHIKTTAALSRHHEDPFDRLLVAQAQAEGMVIVSYDRAFRDYDVPCCRHDFSLCAETDAPHRRVHRGVTSR